MVKKIIMQILVAAFITLAIIFVTSFLIILILPHAPIDDYALCISCSTNLKQIGLALKQYSMDNENFFPPYDNAKGLSLLFNGNYIKDKQIFFCPIALRYFPNEKKFDDESIGYVYRGGLCESDDPNTPICWDKIKNRSKSPHERVKNSINILFIDGQAKAYPIKKWREMEEEFKKLERQRKTTKNIEQKSSTGF